MIHVDENIVGDNVIKIVKISATLCSQPI